MSNRILNDVIIEFKYGTEIGTFKKSIVQTGECQMTKWYNVPAFWRDPQQTGFYFSAGQINKNYKWLTIIFNVVLFAMAQVA